MKKLVLTALLCAGLAQLATGCLIVSDDGDPPPPPPPDTGAIDVGWTLLAGDNNDVVDCPVGISLTVVSEDSFGDQFLDPMDCLVGSGLTGELVPDNYLVWVEMRDEVGDLYAASTPAFVDVVAGADSVIDFEFSLDRGAFDVTWDVQDGGVQINCADFDGATLFSLDYTYENGDFFGPDEFDCALFEATTPGLALGGWSVSPSLIDDTQLAIAVGQSVDTGILYGNEYVDLGHVIFEYQNPFP